MEYEIREYTRFDLDEIMALYESVGWTRYTGDPGRLAPAYANSLKVYGAYGGEQLVGLIRAVGDGMTIVYVQDLLVKPEYQRRGIGRALLTKILKEYKDVYQKTLMTDDTEKTTAFYKSVGMRLDTEIGCRAFLG